MRILLKADRATGSAWSDEAIRQALDIGLSTVARTPTLCRGGLEAALERTNPVATTATWSMASAKPIW